MPSYSSSRSPSIPDSTPSYPSFPIPSSSEGGGGSGVLGVLGAFLDIAIAAQEQEIQRTQSELDAAIEDSRREIERMEAEEEAKKLAEEQARAQFEARRRQEEADDRTRRLAMANPFATNATANTGSAERSSGAANPFRTEADRGSSGIPKAQCISDLQRALLATKKAYLSNTKGATTLNDKSLPSNFEMPRSSCPPASQTNLGGQRRAFEELRSLQYCAGEALKCAITLVSGGADCQASMNSCQTKFVGNLK